MELSTLTCRKLSKNFQAENLKRENSFKIGKEFEEFYLKMSWLCWQNRKQFWLEAHSCVKRIKAIRNNNKKWQQNRTNKQKVFI